MPSPPTGRAGAGPGASGPRRPAKIVAKAPSAKPAAGKAGRARKAGKAWAKRAGGAGRAWRARIFGGASWTGVAVIVLSFLVILPIAAAVLGDIWAVILAALVGGFALGRATAR